jgi:hypothetical protein
LAPSAGRLGTVGRVPALPRSRRRPASGRKGGDAPWIAAGTQPGPPPRQPGRAGPRSDESRG